MANADRPSGFRPHGKVLDTIEQTAGARIFPGDFVTMQSDGKVDPAAAGGDIFGLALSYADADLDKVLLSVAPEQKYIGQANGAEIDALTDIGNIANILATGGDTTYNLSRQEIDSSTIGTGGGGQLVVLALDGEVGNAFGAQANVIVKINEHQAYGTDDFAGV